MKTVEDIPAGRPGGQHPGQGGQQPEPGCLEDPAGSRGLSPRAADIQAQEIDDQGGG